MNTDMLLQAHLKDLANKSYQKNIYTFTNFLSASDLDLFYTILPDIPSIPYEIFGGGGELRPRHDSLWLRRNAWL